MGSLDAALRYFAARRQRPSDPCDDPRFWRRLRELYDRISRRSSCTSDAQDAFWAELPWFLRSRAGRWADEPLTPG